MIRSALTTFAFSVLLANSHAFASGPVLITSPQNGAIVNASNGGIQVHFEANDSYTSMADGDTYEIHPGDTELQGFIDGMQYYDNEDIGYNADDSGLYFSTGMGVPYTNDQIKIIATCTYYSTTNPNKWTLVRDIVTFTVVYG